MKRISWIAAITCGIVFCAATIALAAYEHSRPMGPMGGPGHMDFDRVAVRLKLTPDQETQIKADLKQARVAVKPEFESMRSSREALAKQIFTDQPNAAEIQKNADQLKQQLSAAIDQFVQTGMAVDKLLTPEQRQEMQKIINEHEQLAQRRHAREQQHREHGPGAGHDGPPPPPSK